MFSQWPRSSYENEFSVSKMNFQSGTPLGQFQKNAPVVSHLRKWIFRVEHHWGNFKKCPSGVPPLKIQIHFRKWIFRVGHHWGNFKKCPSGVPPLKIQIHFRKWIFRVGHHWGNFKKCPSGVPPLTIQTQFRKWIFRVGHHWGNLKNAPVVSHLWKYKYSFQNEFSEWDTTGAISKKCPSGVPPFKMKIQASRGFVRLGSHWGIPENGPVMSVLSVCCLGQGYVTSVGGDSM